MKKGSITAAELMAELQNNEEYQQAKALRDKEHQEKVKRRKESVKPVVNELKRNGYNFDHFNHGDFLNKYAPLNDKIVNILLDYLPKTSNDYLGQDTIVRFLGAVSNRYDGRLLIEVFDNTESNDLRFAIANTIAEANPLNVNEWLEKTIKRKDLEIGAFMMLPIAVARMFPTEKANAILNEVYSTSPVNVAQGMAISGAKEELNLLEKEKHKFKGWKKKEFEKAINKIKKRLK